MSHNPIITSKNPSKHPPPQRTVPTKIYKKTLTLKKDPLQAPTKISRNFSNKSVLKVLLMKNPFQLLPINHKITRHNTINMKISIKIKTKTKNKINLKSNSSKEAPGSIYPVQKIENQFRKNPMKGKTGTHNKILTPVDLVLPTLKETKLRPKETFPKTEFLAKETPSTKNQFQNSKL